MVWHLLLFFDRSFLTVLELVAFIHAETVDPVDRFVAEEAKVGLVAYKAVGMLDDESALLWREVVLPIEEEIPQVEINRQVGP
jgi:hypothetical protein